MKALEERTPPWETIGKVVPDGTSTEEAMEIVGMDYEVEIVPATVLLPANPLEYVPVEFPRKRVTYRSDTLTPLGFVGDRYRVLQHREIIPVLDELVGTGWQPLCGGTLRQGAVGWMVGSLPFTPKSGEFEPNLAVMNSFDMSSGLRFANTPLRPSCNNAVQMMMKNSTFTLKHSKNMDVRLRDAREALNIAVAYAERLDEEIERLLAIDIQIPEAKVLVNSIIPIRENTVPGKTFGAKSAKNPRGEWKELSSRAVAIRKERQDSILRHWLTSESLEGIRHTGWGWINALNEMEQWSERAKTNEFQLAEKTLLTQLHSVSDTWTNHAFRSLQDNSFRDRVGQDL